MPSAIINGWSDRYLLSQIDNLEQKKASVFYQYFTPFFGNKTVRSSQNSCQSNFRYFVQMGQMHMKSGQNKFHHMVFIDE